MFNMKMDNKLTPAKTLYLLLVLFNIIILSWFMFNQPAEQAKAMKYLIFSLISLIVWTMDFVISKDKSNLGIINFVTIEKETIIGKLPALIKGMSTAFIVVFSVAIFFFITATRQSIVGSPGFQIIELGQAGKAIITFAIINSENLFFFGFLAPTLFGLFNFIFRGNGGIIALGMASILAPVIFMLYHILAYGFNDMISMMVVFSFGFINVVWLLFMRNLLFSDAVHFSNNFAIEAMKVGV